MSSSTRHSRHQMEATMTAAQVLRYIVDRQGAQTRRFRVEGTAAGNSRLLAHDVAVAERVKYGGKVVELVTMEEIYGERAKALPACRREGCKALAGAPCRNPRGEATNPHKNRFGEPETAPKRKNLAASMASCPECAAAAGAACVTPNGKKRKPHPTRRPMVAEGASS